MAGKQHDWEGDLLRMRDLLYGLLPTDKHSPEPIVEMLKILDRLDAAVRTTMAVTATNSSSQASSPHFRRNKPKSYRIDCRGNTRFLAEYREGGRQPYLCPQDLYEALASEMAETTEPTHFEVLMEGIAQRLGRTPPDYLLRMCIRFWMTSDPPLVEKVRTRYRPIRPTTLLRDARRAWKQVAETSDH